MWDALKSLVDTAATRVKNPFSGAFLFAWLTLNWRVVVLLFSELDTYEKLYWMGVNTEAGFWGVPYLKSLGLPVLFAVLYVWTMPRLKVFIIKHTSKPEADALTEQRGLRIAQAKAARDAREKELEDLTEELETIRANLKIEQSALQELKDSTTKLRNDEQAFKHHVKLFEDQKKRILEDLRS